MSTALAERDDVTVDGEVIEVQPAAQLTLFGTDDPAAIVERATRVATALADVINQRHLTVRIGNRDHVMLEGWTLLGSLVGVFGEIEWTRPVERGWEARAVARTMGGATVGAAEAMCTRAERTWSNRDEYAIRSMAQTRALSKALRLPLGFIVELAGFAATPAEELADEQPQGGERGSRRMGVPPATTRPAADPHPSQRTDEEWALLDDLYAIAGMTEARAILLAKAAGVKGGDHPTADQLREMIEKAGEPGHGLLPDESPEPARAHADPGEPSAPAEEEGRAGSSDQPAPTDTPLAEAGTSAAATPAAASSPPGGEPSAATSYTPETLRTLAAAVLELDASEKWTLAELDDTDYARVLAAIGVTDEGYAGWFGQQPREVRAALRTAKQAPRQRAERAKHDRPTAEQLKAGIEAGS